METTKKMKKDPMMADFVRFSWKATRGLIDNPENHVPYWTEKLGRSGKMTPEQVDQLSEFIEVRTKEARENFLANTDQNIQQTVKKLSALTQQELDKMNAKLDRIEARLAKLS
jgi:polyhydroxyalkanoate synthesis regulator phasin